MHRIQVSEEALHQNYNILHLRRPLFTCQRYNVSVLVQNSIFSLDSGMLFPETGLISKWFLF